VDPDTNVSASGYSSELPLLTDEEVVIAPRRRQSLVVVGAVAVVCLVVAAFVSSNRSGVALMGSAKTLESINFDEENATTEEDASVVDADDHDASADPVKEQPKEAAETEAADAVAGESNETTDADALGEVSKKETKETKAVGGESKESKEETKEPKEEAKDDIKEDASAEKDASEDATEETSTEDADSCAGPGLGGNCIEAGCCADGGKKGLQCFQKNDNYAECMAIGNCTAGVHDGETEGAWSAAGVFELEKWSCKETGKASRPACWAYAQEDKCPDARCVWMNEKCMTKCQNLGDADSCWASGNCMWDGGQCADGCWTVMGEEDCKSADRCMWQAGEDANSSKCGLACHIHGGPDDCPHEDKCFWNGGACVDDPCSAPGEDCRNTKCCSVARGGLGMMCIEKMEFWATCMVEFNATAQPDWSGEILGVRPFEVGQRGTMPKDQGKADPGCNWAGQSCADSKTCCQEGYTCSKKDDEYTGCVQTMGVSTWVKDQIPLPEGWDGTKVGGWHAEYAVEPVAEGGDLAGVSFYCLAAVVPDSYEMELMNIAKANNASIFGCDATSVYPAWQTGGAGWDTGETTLVNTAVFLKVFQYVQQDGIYLNYDWTIKADADCVFVPQRLRDHIYGLRPPPDTAIYLKNNDMEGLGNNGFLGAVEVFTKNAIQLFMDNAEDCGTYLGTNSGEDGFFKGCMDALSVGFLWDRQMFTPNYDPATCTKGQFAAFHPIKFPSHWQRCWDIATGKMCEGMTYDCGGPLDPPVESLAK